MSENRELYHDGALCPECQTSTGVPNIPEGDPPDQVPTFAGQASRLVCAACGHEWKEEDIQEIARAWFAHGAYEQSLRDKQSETTRPRGGGSVPGMKTGFGFGNGQCAIIDTRKGPR